jgi:hypothetical protein
MFYDIKKLNELEKTVVENLMKADGHTVEKDYRQHWVNYRNDMPNCLMVIREFKEILRQLQSKNTNE